MTKKRRIGVIGSGYWGPNLIRNFIELPESKVVAVADLDKAQLVDLSASALENPSPNADVEATMSAAAHKRSTSRRRPRARTLGGSDSSVVPLPTRSPVAAGTCAMAARKVA